MGRAKKRLTNSNRLALRIAQTSSTGINFMKEQHYPFFTNGALICPNCKAGINVAGGVTPGHSGTLRKGGIVICSGCAAPSIVGDSHLEALTKERFERLDPPTRESIKRICSEFKFAMSQNPPPAQN